MLRTAIRGVSFLVVLSLFVGAAYAAPIIGELNITGDVSVGATGIDWLPLGGGMGTFTITPSSTGTFSGLAGSSGTSLDLDVLSQPVGVPFSLPGFFVLPGGINVELTMIDAGVFSSTDCVAAPAPGQTCTPPFPAPKSPFNLTNTAVGSTASFTIRGIATMGGDTSTVIGTYTTQFTGQDYQSMLATIVGGGTVQASYSANFVVGEIPEPSSAYLALGGFAMALAGILRRRVSQGRSRSRL